MIAAAFYALDRSGWVEYRVTLRGRTFTNWKSKGGTRNRYDSDPTFELMVSIDGHQLARATFTARKGRKRRDATPDSLPSQPESPLQ